MDSLMLAAGELFVASFLAWKVPSERDWEREERARDRERERGRQGEREGGRER
jgi:hypothetical protein